MVGDCLVVFQHTQGVWERLPYRFDGNAAVDVEKLGLLLVNSITYRFKVIDHCLSLTIGVIHIPPFGIDDLL